MGDDYEINKYVKEQINPLPFIFSKLHLSLKTYNFLVFRFLVFDYPELGSLTPRTSVFTHFQTVSF